jgi:hypothetical protein
VESEFNSLSTVHLSGQWRVHSPHEKTQAGPQEKNTGEADKTCFS